MNRTHEPIKSLKWFARQSIGAGIKLKLNTTLNESAFEVFHEESGKLEILTGNFKVCIGSSSADSQLQCKEVTLESVHDYRPCHCRSSSNWCSHLDLCVLEKGPRYPHFNPSYRNLSANITIATRTWAYNECFHRSVVLSHAYITGGSRSQNQHKALRFTICDGPEKVPLYVVFRPTASDRKPSFSVVDDPSNFSDHSNLSTFDTLFDPDALSIPHYSIFVRAFNSPPQWRFLSRIAGGFSPTSSTRSPSFIGPHSLLPRATFPIARPTHILQIPSFLPTQRSTQMRTSATVRLTPNSGPSSSTAPSLRKSLSRVDFGVPALSHSFFSVFVERSRSHNLVFAFAHSEHSLE